MPRTPLVPFDWGAAPHPSPQKREKALAWNPSKSTFRASPAPRGHRPPSGGKFELLQPRARRKGVLWAPLDELRAPVLLSTNELLWLPRSPDPRPAMGRAEKATRTSPVSEQVRSRCFCAHFFHSNRAIALLMPKIRLPQAAEGLLIPSCLFGPGRAETKRPSFLPFHPSSSTRSAATAGRGRARAGGAAVIGAAAGRRRGNSRGSSSRGSSRTGAADWNTDWAVEQQPDWGSRLEHRLEQHPAHRAASFT